MAKGGPGSGRHPGLAARMLATKASGFTYDRHGNTPIKGYSVGVFPEKSAKFPADSVTEAQVDGWLADNKLTAFSTGHMVGGWIDHGKLYLDIVKIFPPNQKDAAVAAGKEHNQIAIADMAAIHQGDWHHAFIKTGGTGEMKKQEVPPTLAPKGPQPTTKPKFALFDKNVTGRQILAHFGIKPKQ